MLASAGVTRTGSAATWRIGGPRGGELFTVSTTPACPSPDLYVTGIDTFRSADSGDSWTSTSLSSGVIGSDPSDPHTFFVEQFGEIDVTHDGGLTFSPLTYQDPVTYASQVAVDPTNSSVIFAAVLAPPCNFGTCPPPSAGVFKSVDGGFHWERTSHPGEGSSQILIDPESSSTLYTGSSRSFDGGTTWFPLGTPADDLAWVAIAGTTPETIYAATDEGLFASLDHGRSWSPSGLLGQSVSTLVVSPASPNVLIAGLSSLGAVRSEDGGATWAPTDWNDGNLDSILFDPCDPATIFAAGIDTHDRDFFVSRDAGLHWSRSAVSNEQMSTIAFDHGDPNHLVSSSGFGGLLFESRDAGAHWSFGSVFSPAIGAYVEIRPSVDGSRIFVPDGDLFESNDGGETWSSLGILASAVLPLDNGVLLAASSAGVYRSAAGSSWVRVSTLSNVRQFVAGPSHIYAVLDVYTAAGALDHDEVIASSDGGFSWTTLLTLPSIALFGVSTSAPENLMVTTSLNDQNTLYQSTDAGGHFSSLAGPQISVLAGGAAGAFYAVLTGGLALTTDLGRTWSPLVDTGTCTVGDVVVTPDGKFLHAASDCGVIDVDLEIAAGRRAIAVPPPRPAAGSRR